MSYQPSSGPALVMSRGPQPSSTFLMNKDVITIGRAQGNDLVVDDVGVSRNHARLVQSGHDWILEDLGSVNGTFVNGQRITSPVQLPPGAEVAFGDNVLFSLQGTPVPPGYPPGPAEALVGGEGGFPWLWVIIGAGGLVLLLVLAGLGAYLLLSRRQGPSLASLAAMAQGPDVALQEPANDTQVNLGEEVLVFALARQEKGVTRMELWIDGEVAAQQDSATPAGITPMSLVHTWAGTTPGTKMLLVRAYDSQGAMGMSPMVYLTVLNQPADPPLGEYVVQPGDTLLGVAEEMSSTVPALEEANPALGETITEGETIVVPIPTVIIATPTAPPPPPPPPPPAPQPPPNLPLNAPTLISATPQDCNVTLAWQDNSDNELGFLVYRAVSGVPGFSLLPTTAGAEPGTGNQVQYPDQVPRPDDYVYYVAAANAGGQAASNLAAVNVPPSGACVEPPGYKQVMYQPFTFQPTDPTHISAAEYFSLFGSVFRRIPPGAGDSILVGDWSGVQEAAPVPVSVYLNPADPVLMLVIGEGWPGPDSVGDFLKAHPQNQMVPATVWHGHGQDPVTLKAFDTDYSLWLENVTWGQGSTTLIPPPTDLRVATTGAELDKMWYCQINPCDPLTTRALVWEWTGDPATIEGYVLYRFYSCPGQDAAIPAPDLVSTYSQGKIVPAWTVPSACAARYQVSAFGPAGESAPSAPLDVPATAPLVRLPVTFKTLTLSGLPPGGAWRRVNLTANQYVLKSSTLLFNNGIPRNLAAVFLSGKKPNNELSIGLGEGDALQLGFDIVNPWTNVTIYSKQLTFPPPAGNNWGIHAGTVHVNTIPAYDLTVEIGQPTALAAGQVTRPQADLRYAQLIPLNVIGTDVYVSLNNHGPDDLVGSTAQVTTFWIDPNTSQPVNMQTAPRSITAHLNQTWMFRADAIPPAYVNLQPLPLFHVEWSPVDFDHIGTASKILEAKPLAQ